jgi:hypothetical protein
VITRLEHKGGPGGILPKFVISCSNEQCYPFHYSTPLALEIAPYLQFGYPFFLPPSLKMQPNGPNNYCSLAFNNHDVSIMESVNKDQMFQVPVEKAHISKHQHAFIKRHSTASCSVCRIDLFDLMPICQLIFTMILPKHLT